MDGSSTSAPPPSLTHNVLQSCASASASGSQSMPSASCMARESPSTALPLTRSAGKSGGIAIDAQTASVTG